MDVLKHGLERFILLQFLIQKSSKDGFCQMGNGVTAAFGWIMADGWIVELMINTNTITRYELEN